MRLVVSPREKQNCFPAQNGNKWINKQINKLSKRTHKNRNTGKWASKSLIQSIDQWMNKQMCNTLHTTGWKKTEGLQLKDQTFRDRNRQLDSKPFFACEIRTGEKIQPCSTTTANKSHQLRGSVNLERRAHLLAPAVLLLLFFLVWFWFLLTRDVTLHLLMTSHDVILHLSCVFWHFWNPRQLPRTQSRVMIS